MYVQSKKISLHDEYLDISKGSYVMFQDIMNFLAFILRNIFIKFSAILDPPSWIRHFLLLKLQIRHYRLYNT